jgi:hypothetical protein
MLLKSAPHIHGATVAQTGGAVLESSYSSLFSRGRGFADNRARLKTIEVAPNTGAK